MIVVADTSPIINLAAIGQLDLLNRLYGTLWIPDAVYREIAETGAGEPGSAEVQSLDWIERHNDSIWSPPCVSNSIRAKPRPLPSP